MLNLPNLAVGYVKSLFNAQHPPYMSGFALSPGSTNILKLEDN